MLQILIPPVADMLQNTIKKEVNESFQTNNDCNERLKERSFRQAVLFLYGLWNTYHSLNALTK